jgi:hypothetical protein
VANPSSRLRDVGDRQVKLELILTSVMVEESVEVRLAAGRRASVVVGP